MFFPKADLPRFPGRQPGALGTFHIIRKVKIGGKTFIKKTVRDPDVRGSDLYVEKAASEAARDRGVATPVIRSIDFTSCVMDVAPGQLLIVRPRNADIHLLGKVAAGVHGVLSHGYGRLSPRAAQRGMVLGAWRSWGLYIRTSLSDEIIELTSFNVLKPEEAAGIKKVFRTFRFPEKHRLLHGDLSHHNAFVFKHLVTLIDWEDALIGDPMYDVAYYETGCYSHPEWFTAFTKGYAAGGGYIVKDKIYWAYYVRIALAKTVVMIREGKIRELGDLPLGTRIRFGMKKFINA